MGHGGCHRRLPFEAPCTTERERRILYKVFYQKMLRTSKFALQAIYNTDENKLNIDIGLKTLFSLNNRYNIDTNW